MPLRRLSTSRSLRMAKSEGSAGQPWSPPKDKGKERVIPKRPRSPYDGPGASQTPLSSMLEEALHTPLSPVSIPDSPDSSFERPSLIPAPARAHQPLLLRPNRPRLLYGLARSTMPTSGLTYSSLGERNGLAQHGESSTAWQRPSPTLSDSPFPDLDPAIGLPLEISGPDGPDPSRHLQRTITDLLAALPPTEKPSVIPRFSLTLPRVSLPGTRSSGEMSRTTWREFSSSAPQDDWTTWATGWWSGNKGKVDNTLSEEDQADTVAEEREKHRRKCKPSRLAALMSDRTPKHPLVFCHGLLGFDYLGKHHNVSGLTSTGPTSLPP